MYDADTAGPVAETRTLRASDSTERPEVLRAPLRTDDAEAFLSDALRLKCSSTDVWLAATDWASASVGLRPEPLRLRATDGSTAVLPALLSCSTREFSSTCTAHACLSSRIRSSSNAVADTLCHALKADQGPELPTHYSGVSTHPVQAVALLGSQRPLLL